MKNFKAGIIGLGVGEAHIKGFESHPQCKVVKACDFSDARRAEMSKKYPHLPLTEHADDILNDPEIDIVSIASYDDYHFSQAMKALENGKHIFVEKPLTLYRHEAAILRSTLAKNPDLKMSSNLILRKSPRFQLLKKWIAEGKLGKLYFAEADYLYGRLHKITDGWRGKIDYYSVTYGGGVHMVDLLLWLTGDDVEEVTAYGNRIASEGSQFRYNDFTAALLKFKSGMIAKVTGNYGSVHPHFHGVKLFGKKASFIQEREGARLYTASDPAQSPEAVTEEYPGVHKGDLARDFVESIISGKTPAVTSDEVFKTMNICFAIEESIAKGAPVKVSPLECKSNDLLESKGARK